MRFIAALFLTLSVLLFGVGSSATWAQESPGSSERTDVGPTPTSPGVTPITPITPIAPNPTRDTSEWLSTAMLSPSCAQAQDRMTGKTFLCVESTSGDYIGQGRQWLVTSEQASFRVTGSGWRRIWADVNGTEYWRMTFAPAADHVLGIGRYEGAERAPFQSPGKPGLDVYGNGRACNKVTGRFNIYQVEYAEDGKIQRFSADFEQYCDRGPALLGMIRYEASKAAPTQTPSAATESTQAESSPATTDQSIRPSAFYKTAPGHDYGVGTLLADALGTVLPFILPFVIFGTIALSPTVWASTGNSRLKTVWALWLTDCLSGWLILVGALMIGIFSSAIAQYVLSLASPTSLSGPLIAHSDLAALGALIAGVAIVGALLGAVSGAVQGIVFRSCFPAVKWRLWAIGSALVWPAMFIVSLSLGVLCTYLFLWRDAIPLTFISGAVLGFVLARKRDAFMESKYVEPASTPS